MARRMPTTLERGVLETRLNRTEKNNTLTSAMYGALVDATLEGDRAARVPWITGNGDAFTSGDSVNAFADAATGRATAVSTATGSCWQPRSLKAPMITTINGTATGVGGRHGEPDLR